MSRGSSGGDGIVADSVEGARAAERRVNRSRRELGPEVSRVMRTESQPSEDRERARPCAVPARRTPPERGAGPREGNDRRTSREGMRSDSLGAEADRFGTDETSIPSLRLTRSYADACGRVGFASNILANLTSSADIASWGHRSHPGSSTPNSDTWVVASRDTECRGRPRAAGCA